MKVFTEVKMGGATQPEWNADAPLHGDLFSDWDWRQLTEFTTALSDASKVDVQQLAAEIRQQPIVAKTTWGDSTLLHLVAGQGYQELVALLLELGADVNAYCPEGVPLHAATLSGSLETVKMLVAARSELN